MTEAPNPNVRAQTERRGLTRTGAPDRSRTFLNLTEVELLANQ